MYEKLMTCLESVRKKIDFKPEVALILGSGLGDFADGIQIEQTIDYTDIEGFPVSTVKGHKGRFVFGYVEKTPVVIMQGVFIIMKDTQCQMLFFQRVLWECLVRKKSFSPMLQEELILPMNREIS